MINPMVIAGLSLLCSDGNPGRRGGCWLYAEALSPRWGEQAGSETEGGERSNCDADSGTSYLSSEIRQREQDCWRQRHNVPLRKGFL